VSVILGICLIISVLTFVIGREYNKISVLDALRGGINAHNYKKNYFAFDRTSLPVAITMSLKETFGKFRSQIGIIFIMTLLTISTMVGFGMVDSYGRDEQGIINMGGFIMTDAQATGDNAMADNITAMSSVSNVYRDIWISLNFYKGKNMQSITTRAFSDTSNINGGGLVEGRWPTHPNEVMFATNAAIRLNVGVGDSVTVKNNRAEESYLVCGLCQTMNNMGMMAFMTMDGMNRVINVSNTSNNINIDLKKGRSFDDFEKEFKDIYPDEEITNVTESIKGTIGMVSSGTRAVAILIAVLTILIVAFVESLIIRTHITRSWRDMGVSKALGYTSGQLILQTMLSNLPAILIGVFIGLLLSPMATANSMTAIFSIFGFRDAGVRINPSSFVLAAFLIISVAITTSAIMGRRIKGLEPVKMITEE
nr:ABC transporter permease [Lachnospiraceae bacterium]